MSQNAGFQTLDELLSNRNSKMVKENFRRYLRIMSNNAKLNISKVKNEKFKANKKYQSGS